MTQPIRLEGLLRQEELVTPEQLARARGVRGKTGEPLAEVLIRLKLIDEDDLFFLLSRGLLAPTVPEERLLHLTMGPELRRTVPPSLARRGICVPFDLDKTGRRLSVAMIDPSDQETVGRLRQSSGAADVRCYLARRSVILGAIEAGYGGVEEESTDPRAVSSDPPATQIELIPGKVSLDPGMFEEMAAISPRLAEESLRRPPKAQGREGPVARRPSSPQLPIGKAALANNPPAGAPLVPPMGAGGAKLARPPTMPALPVDAREQQPGPAPRRALAERRRGRPGLGPRVDEAELAQTRVARAPESAAPRRKSGEVQRPGEITTEQALPKAKAPAPPPLATILDRRQVDDRTPIDRSTFEEVRERARTLLRLPVGASKPAGSGKPGDEHLADTPPIAERLPATDRTPVVEKTFGEASGQRAKGDERPDEPQGATQDVALEAGGAADPPEPAEESSEEDVALLEEAVVLSEALDDGEDLDAEEEEERQGQGRTRVDARLSDFGAPPTPEDDGTKETSLKEGKATGEGAEADDDAEAAAAEPAVADGTARGVVSQARTGAYPRPIGLDTQTEAQVPAEPGTDEQRIVDVGERAARLRDDLASGMESLIGLLAERADPGGSGTNEYGQLARAIAAELALGAEAALGAGVAAQLFALDGLLRREQGDAPLGDLIAVFDVQSGEPGGLNQALRAVGTRCLELDADSDLLSAGVVIVALVRDYLDLRTSDPESDLETVVQLLRTGGADPLFLDALVRAVEQTEGHAQRTERSRLL